MGAAAARIAGFVFPARTRVDAISITVAGSRGFVPVSPARLRRQRRAGKSHFLPHSWPDIPVTYCDAAETCRQEAAASGFALEDTLNLGRDSHRASQRYCHPQQALILLYSAAQECEEA